MHDHGTHAETCDHPHHAEDGNDQQKSAARKTRQRDAIRAAIAAAKRPLAPNEILESAQADVPKLGLATVYRNLRQMHEEAELTAVEVPGQGVRYEIAGLKHHHHFCCRDCGRVFDVQGCPGGLDGLVPKGFRLERHELLLFGLCDTCTAKAA